MSQPNIRHISDCNFPQANFHLNNGNKVKEEAGVIDFLIYVSFLIYVYFLIYVSLSLSLYIYIYIYVASIYGCVRVTVYCLHCACV